jgi:heterodisulfide reductase subunit A-like polyferredoxin
MFLYILHHSIMTRNDLALTTDTEVQQVSLSIGCVRIKQNKKPLLALRDNEDGHMAVTPAQFPSNQL